MTHLWLATCYSKAIFQVFLKFCLFLLALALPVTLLSDTDHETKLVASTLKSNETQLSTLSSLDHLALQILHEAEFLALYSSYLFSLCSLTLPYSLAVALILLFPSLFTGAITPDKNNSHKVNLSKRKLSHAGR